MTVTDFSTSILVDQTPEEAFEAINNVRGWWSEEVAGDTDKLGAEFDYQYHQGHICKFRIIELIPGKKVVWLTLENYFSFVKDQSEWVNTKVIFEISKEDHQTKIVFTHDGLIPEHECFDTCSNAWTKYIQKSLKDLISRGKGYPNPISKEY